MEPVLNEQQALLRDGAVKLCREIGGPKRAREMRNGGLEMDAQAWKHFADGGWLGTAVPEEAGGLGMGIFELTLALEEAGRQLIALPLVEASAAAWAIARSDNKAALDELLSGALVAVPALAQEGWSGKGDVPLNLEGKTVSGKLRHVPYAPSAGALVVEAGDALCLVRKGNGVKATPAANVDGSTSSEVTFSKASAEVISTGAKANELRDRMREMLALGAAAGLVGVSGAALDMTLEYIKVRQQFGKALGSFQALQHRAADCFVEVELNRSLVYRVSAAWDAGQYHPAMVSAAKARATRSALEITRNALQLHGAIGYTDEHDIGLYYKRAVVLAALYGNEANHTGRFSKLTLEA